MDGTHDGLSAVLAVMVGRTLRDVFTDADAASRYTAYWSRVGYEWGTRSGRWPHLFGAV